MTGTTVDGMEFPNAVELHALEGAEEKANHSLYNLHEVYQVIIINFLKLIQQLYLLIHIFINFKLLV